MPKYHYYRVWKGDSNDRHEWTDHICCGIRGCIKAIDIEHAIAQVKRQYIGKENLKHWEDNGQGDNTIAFLDYIVLPEDCRQCKIDNGLEADAEIDTDEFCQECYPGSLYIQIEEIGI